MRALIKSAIIIGIIWFVFIFFGSNAIVFGIHPRDIHSLRGILFSPFIHANLIHIISNTVPLFVLTFLLALIYKKQWFTIFMIISVLAGIMVWLLARGSRFGSPVYHVGASITIFGLIAFFLTSGIVKRTFRDILIAIIVGVTYGGALWGILPTNPFISWEGHLFGAIAGIFVAMLYKNIPQKSDKF